MLQFCIMRAHHVMLFLKRVGGGEKKKTRPLLLPRARPKLALSLGADSTSGSQRSLSGPVSLLSPAVLTSAVWDRITNQALAKNLMNGLIFAFIASNGGGGGGNPNTQGGYFHKFLEPTEGRAWGVSSLLPSHSPRQACGLLPLGQRERSEISPRTHQAVSQQRLPSRAATAGLTEGAAAAPCPACLPAEEESCGVPR